MPLKPWLDSVYKPTVGPLTEDNSQVPFTYQIDFVHGY
jgi:hypothetical protein